MPTTPSTTVASSRRRDAAVTAARARALLGSPVPSPREALSQPATSHGSTGVAGALGAAFAAPRRAARWTSSAARAVASVPGLVGAVQALVVDVGRTAAEARTVVHLAHDVALDAARIVGTADAQLDRARALLDLMEPAMLEAGPTLGRAASAVRPQHVDALVNLVELTPELVDLIVPALEGMGGVGPELEQLVERFESISQVVEGLPGASRLKKRGQEQETDA